MGEPSCYVTKKPKLVLQYPSSAREITAYKLSSGETNRTVLLSQPYFLCEEGKAHLTFNPKAILVLFLSFVLE